jgi:glutamine amidotransferase
MITIIDYGVGNVCSVMNALSFLGVKSELTSNPERIRCADKLILPGVGAFGFAMARLHRLGLVSVIRQAALQHKIPILGICLGMHLFAEIGEEQGECLGLGLIPGRVRHINNLDPNIKVPHIGFNSITCNRESNLFMGLNESTDFYFVHSYQFETSDLYVSATVEYADIYLTAAVESNLIFGVQFHPEKSQSNGLKILNNFSRSHLC